MAKFIVRESSGEFYKTIVADDIHKAEFQLCGGNSNALSFWGYKIEPAPEAEVFESNDWLEDFNNPASRHHY